MINIKDFLSQPMPDNPDELIDRIDKAICEMKAHKEASESTFTLETVGRMIRVTTDLTRCVTHLGSIGMNVAQKQSLVRILDRIKDDLHLGREYDSLRSLLSK